MTNRPDPVTTASPDAGAVTLIGREEERNRLELYLTKGMHCQIVGPAGIGKTALLTNVGQIAARLGNNFRVAYVDLSDQRCQTVRGLLERISAAWDLRPAFTSLGDLDERVRTWRRSGIRPVLCLDNFEVLLHQDREFTSDFFVDLRGVAQAGLTIMTTSREPLSTLIPWYTRTSPFFNIFDILRVGPLPGAAAEELLASQCPGGPAFTSQEKEALLHFANGSPLALQAVCELAVRAKENGESVEATVTRAAEELRARLPSWTPSRS